jgi:hypothetical protein
MDDPLAAVLFTRRTDDLRMMKFWLDAAVTLRLTFVVRPTEIPESFTSWTNPGWEVLFYEVPKCEEPREGAA